MLKQLSLSLAVLVAGCGAVPLSPTPVDEVVRWHIRSITVSGVLDQSVLAEASDASGLSLVPNRDGLVVAVVDMEDPAFAERIGGYTRLYLSGNKIVGARVVFRSKEVIGQSGLHELGHVLGLGHSAEPADVMYPTAPHPTRFSQRERDTLREMYP